MWLSRIDSVGLELIKTNSIVQAGTKIIPTFHPAALLRDASKKKLVWQDFKLIRELYTKIKR